MFFVEKLAGVLACTFGCLQFLAVSTLALGDSGDGQVPVSGWGDLVNGLRCRVLTCELTRDNDPVYRTRIRLVLEVENVASSGKRLRILAPHSGEPAFALMTKSRKEWHCIGNMFDSPETQTVQDVSPTEILTVSFSLGLTDSEAHPVLQGAALRSVIIAYGKGPYDPASLFSGEFLLPRRIVNRSAKGRLGPGPRLKTQEAAIDESDPTNETDRSTDRKRVMGQTQ